MNISVIAHPGSKKGPLLTEEIDLSGQKVYHVRVSEKPIDGQANDAVCRMVADFFQVPRKTVYLLSGEKSKYKIITIS